MRRDVPAASAQPSLAEHTEAGAAIGEHHLADAQPGRLVAKHAREPHGGHLGYVARSERPFGTRRWLPYALVHYAKGLLQRPL